MRPRREQARGGDGSRELEHSRRRADWVVGQAASRLGVSVREYRELEASERWPSWETFHRICEQTLARTVPV